MNNEIDEKFLYDQNVFVHPFNCIISGPTGCGKTFLLMEILSRLEIMIDRPPNRIIYCYSEYQPVFACIQKIVELHQGLINLCEIDPDIRNLIIYDDLMDECQNNQEIKNLFTKGSHHRNISVILMSQNLFNKGKHARTQSLNSHYTIVFDNPKDRSQIGFLSRQMYPENPKFLIKVFADVTKEPRGYLFIDTTARTSNRIRIQTNIVEDIRIVYEPKF